MPICVVDNSDETYYMVDCLFKQKAMTELYDDIVDKIIQHHVIKFVVENNIDTSLKTLLQEKLEAKGYHDCEIIEKFNTAPKEKRIKDMRGIIKRRVAFKEKNKHISLTLTTASLCKTSQHTRLTMQINTTTHPIV